MGHQIRKWMLTHQWTLCLTLDLLMTPTKLPQSFRCPHPFLSHPFLPRLHIQLQTLPLKTPPSLSQLPHLPIPCPTAPHQSVRFLHHPSLRFVHSQPSHLFKHLSVLHLTLSHPPLINQSCQPHPSLWPHPPLWQCLVLSPHLLL